MMAIGMYWDDYDQEQEGEVIERKGNLVLMRDLDGVTESWVHWSNVDEEALSEYDHDNGQFGVGA